MLRTTMTTAAVALCSATMCWADEPGELLTIGDPARPTEITHLDITHWLKGDPVESFEQGKVYVLEFWATWCGPCKASIPHISELQEKYGDYNVTFIGVSDEPLSTVVKFLCTADKEGKLWNDKIAYTLATDPDKSVKQHYFTAAGRRGIPSAFIIGKDTHIEWIGHPMGIDDALESVVKDTWDRDAFKAKWERQRAAEQKASELREAIREARADEQWEQLIEAFDEITALGEQYSQYKVDKFIVYVRHLNQPEKGYAYGRTIMREHWDDAYVLNRLAWIIVDKEGIQTRDYDLAMDAAMRANELTEEQDASILDTVARVFYEKGDLKMAVHWQRVASEFAGDGRMAEDIRETLEKYEKEIERE